MAYGCVPVVSALPCFADYVKDRVNGVVFSHHGVSGVQNLTRELLRLVQAPAEVATLALAAVQKSREYELGGVASLYLADFGSLC